VEAAMVDLRFGEANDVRSVIDRVQRFHVCILTNPEFHSCENGLEAYRPLYASR